MAGMVPTQPTPIRASASSSSSSRRHGFCCTAVMYRNLFLADGVAAQPLLFPPAIYSFRTALRLIPFCFPPSGQPDSKDRFAAGARNRRGSLCGGEICRKVCVCVPIAMYVVGGFAFCFFRRGCERPLGGVRAAVVLLLRWDIARSSYAFGMDRSGYMGGMARSRGGFPYEAVTAPLRSRPIGSVPVAQADQAGEKIASFLRAEFARLASSAWRPMTVSYPPTFGPPTSGYTLAREHPYMHRSWVGYTLWLTSKSVTIYSRRIYYVHVVYVSKHTSTLV